MSKWMEVREAWPYISDPTYMEVGAGGGGGGGGGNTFQLKENELYISS